MLPTLVTLAQLIIAVSIVIVWVFRFDNIVLEFKHYGLSDLTRNVVGATKIVLATLLVAGIWYPKLVFVPALLMALLMVAALFTHFRVRNPVVKYLPALGLLVLSLFLAFTYSGVFLK